MRLDDAFWGYNCIVNGVILSDVFHFKFIIDWTNSNDAFDDQYVLEEEISVMHLSVNA